MRSPRRHTRASRAFLIALSCVLVGALLFLSISPASATTYTVNFDGGYAYTLLLGTLQGSGGNPNGYIDGATTTTASCGTSITSVDVYALITLGAGEYVSNVTIDVRGQGGGNAGWTIILFNGTTVLQTFTGTHSNNNTWATKSTGAINYSTVTKVYAEHYTCGVIGLSTDLDNIVINTAFVPTATPTATGTLPPTATPTITPTSLAPPGSGQLYMPCIPMRDPLTGDKFAFLDGAALTGSNFISLPPGSTALSTVVLRTDRQYEVTITHSGSDESDQSFSFLLGGAEPYSISVPTPSGYYATSTIPAQNYPTNSGGGWVLSIYRPSGDTGPLTIYNVCVRESGTIGGGAGGDNGPEQTVCISCDQPEDVWGLLGWLWCNLRRFLECVLLSAIKGIWDFVGNLLLVSLAFIRWVGDSLSGTTSWLGQIGKAFVLVVLGQLGNVIQTLANGFLSGFLGDSFNQIGSTARDTPTLLANQLDGVLAPAQIVFTDVGDLISSFLMMIRLFLDALGLLFQLIPILINALITGFNAAATPISGSPLCSNPSNLLYYPCFGFYVLDNTVFEGPARFLTPFAYGLLVFDTIIWVISKFKESFGGVAT